MQQNLTCSLDDQLFQNENQFKKSSQSAKNIAKFSFSSPIISNLKRKRSNSSYMDSPSTPHGQSQRIIMNGRECQNNGITVNILQNRYDIRPYFTSKNMGVQ